MAQWFQTGGWSMYLVLLLALAFGPVELLVVGLALLGRWTGGGTLTVARLAAVGAVLLAGLPGCAGLLGWLDGRSKVNEALAFVDPAMAEELQRVGYAEALVPLQFGSGVAVALLGLALLACVIALPPSRAPAEG